MHDLYVCLLKFIIKVTIIIYTIFAYFYVFVEVLSKNTEIGIISRLAYPYGRIILLLVDLSWSYSQLSSVQKDIHSLLAVCDLPSRLPYLV